MPTQPGQSPSRRLHLASIDYRISATLRASTRTTRKRDDAINIQQAIVYRSVDKEIVIYTYIERKLRISDQPKSVPLFYIAVYGAK
jgi:hypothetical protein